MSGHDVTPSQEAVAVPETGVDESSVVADYTEAVVPARSLTLSGSFSMRTITGMRCASRIHSKVGLTEGNSSKPVLPFCWAMPQLMLSTLPSKGVSG